MSFNPSPGRPAEVASPELRARVLRVYRRRSRLAIAGALVCVSFTAFTTIPLMQSGHGDAVAPSLASEDAPLRDVAVLDHALQVAYSRGASDDEVAPLWHERERLLRILQSRSI